MWFYGRQTNINLGDPDAYLFIFFSFFEQIMSVIWYGCQDSSGIDIDIDTWHTVHTEMGPGDLTIQQTLLLIVSWTEQTTHKPEVNKQFSVTKLFPRSDIKEDLKSFWPLLLDSLDNKVLRCCRDGVHQQPDRHLGVPGVHDHWEGDPHHSVPSLHTVCLCITNINAGSPVSARGPSPGCWRCPPGCWARCTRCPPPPGSGADTPSWRTAWGGSLGEGSKTPASYGICEAKKSDQLYVFWDQSWLVTWCYD